MINYLLGAQLDVGRRGRLGVTIRGPRFRLDDEVRQSFVATEALDDGMSTGFSDVSDDFSARINDLTSPLAAPFEIVLAGGFVTERCRAGAELDLSHRYSGLSEYIFTYNLRAGVRLEPGGPEHSG